ncbi:MAG: holin [Vallitaleaceae bacterium]|nr:holin [Vallitaleaceae bacterium]
MNKLTVIWFKAALIRAIKTMAQTLLAMMTIGMGMDDMDWMRALSVAAIAGIMSILTSIAGLPEVDAQTNQSL